MNKPTIAEILAPKPKARPRIYAYSIADEAHTGLLKVGQTARDVKLRIAEQVKTAAIKNYQIELDEPAERDDGTVFSDHEVRTALVRKGFKNTELEWMQCTAADVRTVLAELRSGQKFSGTHHQTFHMRREQAEAVNVTHAYFHSRWAEDMHAVPRFLWNAKMRFGKTFTSYQLAKSLAQSGFWSSPSNLQSRMHGRPTLKAMWILTVGNTYQNHRAATRHRLIATSLLFISVLFRTCWVVTRLETSRRKTHGSIRKTGTSWCLMNIISARGARPPRNCSRAKKKRSLKKKPSLNTLPIWMG